MQYTLIFAAIAGLATATPSLNARQDACASACGAAYNTCRTQADANLSSCAASYAGCLGYSPYSNGTLVMPTACSITTSPTATPATTTTQVVTALTTYCPSATTLVVNSKTYTVTSATTLTITDCPCTVTGVYTTSSPTTTSSLVQYTGAADSVKPAMGLLALGAMALF